MNEFVKILADLGSFGLLAWLVYYVFKTLLPKLMADFTNQLHSQRKDFESILATLRQDHKEELAIQRAYFREELQRERDAFGRLVEHLRGK